MSAAFPGNGQRGRRTDAGRHRALLYEKPEELVRAASALVREGLRAGEQVLAVLPGDKLARLRSEVDGDPEGVEYADTAVFHRHHGRATRQKADWLARHATGGRRARIISAPPLRGDDEAAIGELMRSEAASNALYGQFGVSVVCAFDVSAVPEPVVAEVHRTHPELERGGGVSPSPLYTDPADYLRSRWAADQVPDPPTSAESLSLASLSDLAAARRLLRRRAFAAGLDAQATGSLLVAAGELAANALAYGRAPRRLSVWTDTPATRLACQVVDGGPGLADPLASYLAPRRLALHGHGLWLARQLADSTDIASGPAGTRIRLDFRLTAGQAGARRE